MATDFTPVIPEGLEDDPRVYEAMLDLALHTIEISKEILDTAAPAQQLQMIRILMPKLVSTLTRGGEDENEELRRQVGEMYQAVRDSLPGGEDA